MASERVRSGRREAGVTPYYPGMSARLGRLVDHLVAEGRAVLAQPRQPASFAYDPASDALLNDIEHHPQAFVLGCLANRMGNRCAN